MSDQEEKEDCKVCKKLFTHKNPSIMADDVSTVIKCMASDVDSSSSCSEKSHRHGQIHVSAIGAMKEKPIPKSRLSVKPKSVVELNYDGDSSDNCSEKGQTVKNVTAKSDVNMLSHNLTTKPPKVKSVRSLVDGKNQLDPKQSSCKSAREKTSKSSRKIKLTPDDRDNFEKEIQNKIANRSHLQNIIDEAMDHFQKLSSRSVPDKTKEIRKIKEVGSNNNRDGIDIPTTVSDSSFESERMVSPDRPSSREDTISPNRKHLVLPATDNRSSPNGSVSGSRRKLPQPPGQNKLRCSVTALVHSSIDSDSSRPNSSADFSDISDCSSVSKSDHTSSIGNASVHKSGNESSKPIDKSNKSVAEEFSQIVDNGGTHNAADVGDSLNTKLCSKLLGTKTEQHSSNVKEASCDKLRVSVININKQSETDVTHNQKSFHEQELDESVVNLNESDSSTCTSIDESKIKAAHNRSNNCLDLSNVSVASSSDETVTMQDKSIVSPSSSDKDSAINHHSCESGKENELKPTNHKHVSRSPSYRKKVMAKARSRYHRQLISLKCKTGECNGNCSICGSQTMELVPRSHTSLGVPVEILNEEEYLEQSSPRRACTPEPPTLPFGKSSGVGQRTLKKVPVSSRVDLLMSSNLFKKHLTKHEDLLHRHTLSYRKFGLQKAVSNLDLSEGCLLDDSGDSEVFKDSGDYEPNSLNSSLKLTSSKPKHTSRRYSLTGENDNSMSELINNHENTQREENRGQSSRAMIPSLDEYRASNKSRETQVPSFAEFRQNRSQKRRLLPSNTVIRSSDKNSSQNAANVNQKNNVNVSDCINASNNEHIAEISEITYSKGSLDTIDESSASNQNKNVKANIQGLQSISPSFSENKISVIVDNKISECLEHKPGEKDSFDQNKRMQTNIEPTVESSLESTGNFDIAFVCGSLIAEDKSPLSTSEIDSVEISGRRINSETDSVGSQELSCSDFSASEVSNASVTKSAMKERHRKGAKRPRSLISKKASLISLIKESESKENKDNTNSSAPNRPTVRRGNSLNSVLKIDKHTVDDRDEKIRADSFRSEGHHKQYNGGSHIEPAKNEFGHSRVAAAKGGHSDGILEGVNSVHFTLETDAQSEASHEVKEVESEDASQPGSVASESLNSEVSGLLDDEGGVFSETFEFDVQKDLEVGPKTCKDDTLAPVLRSTSDACDATPEALKKRRERKERPYKSDPFSGTEIIPASKRYYIREERARLGKHHSFANSSREEILDFLDNVSSQGQLAPTDSFPSLEELNEDDEQNLSVSDVTTGSTKKIRNLTSSASTASTDSGVIGQEESHDSQQSSPSNTLTRAQRLSWSEFRHRPGNQPHISASCSDLTRAEMEGCLDCGHVKKLDVQTVLQICSRCYQRRVERKKTFQEIIETEVNYGRDLNILKEEFYEPMKKTCLLNKDQLDSIFLNLDELIHVNTYFLGKLRAAINTANHSNDEDLQDVRIGSLFLESSSMFLTFESYCVNQAQAPVLLEQLEREKELLRIFLHVSQNDNHLLRRMHLKSFLMVPVQRIMKYPMLLDRLYKATPSKNEDKEAIKEAKEKIEDILGHINAKSKVSITGSIKQSQKRKLSERHCSVTEKIEVLRVALESLGWSRKDVCDVITSRLHLAVPVDHLWAAKKCKSLKFSPALGVLLTLGEPSFEQSDKNLVFPNNSSVRSAAVVLIREKNGKYQVFREPLMLEKCVVSQDPDFTEVFEVLEWNKESLLIKADSQNETNQWVVYLRQQMQQLGCWRKRRNALPNILLNHLSQ